LAKIRFLPEDKLIDFDVNKTILELAIDNDVYIESQCEEGNCSTCMVNVESGKKLLTENNKDFIEDFGSILACITQLKEYSDKEIIIRI